MFWLVSGIGMLINTISGISQASKARKAMKKQEEELEKMRQASLQTMQASQQDLSMSHLQSQYNLPQYPQQAYQNLHDTQFNHYAQQQSLYADVRNGVEQKTNQFWQNNHYQTQPNSTGGFSVAHNAQGQPIIKPGGETSEIGAARLSYEAEQRDALKEKHRSERDSFLGLTRDRFHSYIHQNRRTLSKRSTQKELHTMVTESRQNALEIQQRQEKEEFFVNIPRDPGVQEYAEQGWQQIGSLTQQHQQIEANSPDVQEIVNYQQTVAEALASNIERLQNEQQQDSFLTMKDPRLAFGSQASAPASQPVDIGQVLPHYISSHLYELGIQQVNIG